MLVLNQKYVFVKAHYCLNKNCVKLCVVCHFNLISSTIYSAQLTLIIVLVSGDEQERCYENDLCVIHSNAVL